jgi:hypothetical protein
MGKIQMQEANQVDQWMRNGAKFMFIPSSSLVEIVAKDEHPMVKGMPNPIKYVIMQNKPIRIEGSMALDYYLGTMDNKNCFVLDRGDIKIIPERFEVKKKEEND